ncbi:hypothetical protein [Synechococcus sp. MU1611]|uniref:hypothetical protein n=1 Tax=Synechococcus sp. MU1611 TaxID=2508345 RepID=UPI001CF91478|nr:hypothetical protein [Synechococcus sp. MU1611]MCB4412139.1 hypothetical protein [Synechococcus sp. MU1611]
MKKILFLGTSHVGCFVKAQTRLEPLEGFEFHFKRLSVPLWRLLLNQAELKLEGESLVFALHNPRELLDLLGRAGQEFDLLFNSLNTVIENPVIVDDLCSYDAIVFIDCLFRFPSGLECVRQGHSLLYSWFGQLITPALLLELPNVAGSITSFTEPFISQGLTFDSSRSTTFLDVLEKVQSCPGITPVQALWRVPGFSSDATDVEAVTSIHAFALKQRLIKLKLLQPSLSLLDPVTNRVRQEFLGWANHGSPEFGFLALREIMATLKC